jgi:hypothetical protein
MCFHYEKRGDLQLALHDTPLSSLMDSTMNPKVKIMKGRVGACSLAHNTSGIEGCARALGWD